MADRRVQYTGGAEGKLKAEQHWERHDKVRRPCPLAAAVMGSV